MRVRMFTMFMLVWSLALVCSLINGSAVMAQDDYAQQLIALVNQERTSRGLTSLTPHISLMFAAIAHSTDMGDHGVCQHDSTDGTSWSERIQEYGYTPYRLIGENVGCGSATPRAQVDAWMASEGHRANILTADFEHVGAGYYHTSTGYQHYWTMDFGDPSSSTPPPCPIKVAVEGHSAWSDLHVLRQFRDEVMASSPTGQHYIELYYRHAPEIAGMLLRDRKLRAQTAALLYELMPGIRDMLGRPDGQKVVLSTDLIQRIETLLGTYAQRGSPELSKTIEGIRQELKRVEGKTLGEAWQAIASTEP